MKRIGRSTVAAAFAVGALSALCAPAAQAALEPSVLEAIETPEVALVAQEIAALLDNLGAGAEEQEISAALHRYLSESVYDDSVLEDALGVVLAGEWSPTQLAGLRSIFAEYAPQNLDAPGGAGAAPPAPGSTLARAGVTETSADAETAQEQAASRAQIQGLIEPPPPPAGGGGSSDYRQ